MVAFAQLVMPAPAAGSLAGTLTHFLNPDDVTILKRGTVTFVINNDGHGVAIYPVDKKTTREDIAEDLCQGPTGTAESDRAHYLNDHMFGFVNVVGGDGNDEQ